MQARSLELAGLWNVNGVGDVVLAAAGNDRLPVTVREAAFGALVALKVPAGRGVLEKSTGGLASGRVGVGGCAVTGFD
ncbi:MAG: hypothetical protein CM1200mP2_06790 [Planctomycetaceae bacterium]|nr:MAG: hypothetical protein CM1200mP2_06790 [Planctomycetaceae bacterium]